MLSIKKLTALAVAAAMAVTLTACGGSSTSSGSENAGGTGTGSGGSSPLLTLGVVGPPTSFAAANAAWANESAYLQAVYDGLLRESPNAEIEPWLATEWSYNADNTVLTMKLRTDVTFTDGTQFNADVAAKNVMRFKTGTSPNASALALVADAVAVDDATLQITLSAPDPALLINLAQNAGLQAAPATFDAADAQTNPIGSGPYVLDAAGTVVGSTYAFTKNPSYWAPEQQRYDKITMTVLSDVQAALNAVQGSQVDVMPLVDNQVGAQVEGAGYSLIQGEGGWAGLMLLDHAGQLTPAMGDVRVRQAIAHAIDRQAMIDAGGGFGSVTGQIFSPVDPAYDKTLNDQYPYDPAKAKQLLSDAGYPDGFTLQMPLIQVGTTVAFDLVKQYLADVGITVDYVETPLANIVTDLLAQKFSATYFFLGSYPTTWQTANFAVTLTSPFNVFRTVDPKIDAWVSTIQTGSEDEAKTAGLELNKYIVDQAWFVPFNTQVGSIAVGPNTQLELQVDNAYPYLWNITPKG